MVLAFHFRIILTMIFVSALMISGYFRRQARQTGETIPRRAEGIWVLIGRMVMVIPLLGSILLYIIRPSWMSWASFKGSMLLAWIGVGLGALCLVMIVWVFLSLGENISETVLTKQNHVLVKNGPYHWVRHPLYSTAMFLLLSFSLITASWFLGLSCLLAVILFRLVVIPAEERNLIAIFGLEYEDYRAQTGALLPKVIG